ncbi:hypothetical protein Salat_0181100 [Sesamum alatum]|uniref:Uncharacterized protein n=1 Tax=Sesamum alatum TaxID=300844 RepID=A0AAE2CXT9_9LAMI|nr:hypothetical protein Salat_0181100 [Sesamum alatum]
MQATQVTETALDMGMMMKFEEVGIEGKGENNEMVHLLGGMTLKQACSADPILVYVPLLFNGTSRGWLNPASRRVDLDIAQVERATHGQKRFHFEAAWLRDRTCELTVTASRCLGNSETTAARVQSRIQSCS